MLLLGDSVDAAEPTFQQNMGRRVPDVDRNDHAALPGIHQGLLEIQPAAHFPAASASQHSQNETVGLAIPVTILPANRWLPVPNESVDRSQPTVNWHANNAQRVLHLPIHNSQRDPNMNTMTTMNGNSSRARPVPNVQTGNPVPRADDRDSPGASPRLFNGSLPTLDQSAHFALPMVEDLNNNRFPAVTILASITTNRAPNETVHDAIRVLHKREHGPLPAE